MEREELIPRETGNLRGQQVTRLGGGSLGQVGDSKQPPDLHRPGCVKTTSAVSQGSALCLWEAKT